jgi:flagellar hook-associated protein 3 FlgL
MRITSSMMGNQFLRGANRALSDVHKYNLQVASGKRLTSIADDPAGTTAVLRARTKIASLADYRSNVTTASSYLKEVEAAVTDLDELLQTVYGEVISAMSGGKTKEDLRAIAEQVRVLRDEVVAIGNTSIGTSYLFGGYNFTGTITDTDKKAPFVVDNVNGHLYYNQINLSLYSWYDEYDNYTRLMDLNFHNPDKDANSLKEIVDAFDAAGYSEMYAKRQGELAYEMLSSIILAGENALYSARQCDVDITEPLYQDFEQLFLGGVDADGNEFEGLKSLRERLFNEMSKELRGDYILYDDPDIKTKPDGSIDFEYYEERGIKVYTADNMDEFANKFDAQKVQDIFDEIYALIGDDGSVYKAAADALAGHIRTEKLGEGTEDDLMLIIGEEMKKRPTLPVGLNQEAAYTINGIELMGEGRHNIYHVLDKIYRILSPEDETRKIDEKELSLAISTLQEAQSNVLTRLTEIGASQNRLTLLSNRIDSTTLNYSLMRSLAEEVDYAEASINLATAQTVYNAALAGGAQILRTSLIDYLR